MTDDGVVWDVAGRQASAQQFRTLTDEQQQFLQSFRAELGTGSLLQDPDFDGPYQTFLSALFGGFEEQVADLGRVGEGQALMGARDREAEKANEVIFDHGGSWA
ncbi:hypothetical protein [Nonomuraea sp. NPDC049400]|uniref:hypothetical protein n=1 Tax=Nonomuraea sp. NPDC049400 TaxID=3364352 RepID=UPI0037AC3AAF